MEAMHSFINSMFPVNSRNHEQITKENQIRRTLQNKSLYFPFVLSRVPSVLKSVLIYIFLVLLKYEKLSWYSDIIKVSG